MKIKLLVNIPVSEIHKMLKGNIYETIKKDDNRTWVKSHTTGDEIKLMNHEFEIVDGE